MLTASAFFYLLSSTFADQLRLEPSSDQGTSLLTVKAESADAGSHAGNFLADHISSQLANLKAASEGIRESARKLDIELGVRPNVNVVAKSTPAVVDKAPASEAQTNSVTKAEVEEERSVVLEPAVFALAPPGPLLSMVSLKSGPSVWVIVGLSVAGVVVLGGLGYVYYKYTQWVPRRPQAKQGYRALAKAKAQEGGSSDNGESSTPSKSAFVASISPQGTPEGSDEVKRVSKYKSRRFEEGEPPAP